MDLFERYLQAVRSFLPKRQQDDVVRELSEELRSQAEEQEAQLGRPLNESEQEEILKQWGHPLLLASRYQPQRQLVGPVVFPIYWLVLRIALGIALLVHVIAAAVFVASGRPLADAVANLARLPLGPLLVVFAWVTLVFAVLDRSVLRLPLVAKWNPRSLPHVPTHDRSSSMSCRITEVALGTIFVLWLAALPSNQWLMFGPASMLMELGAPVLQIHLPLLLLALSGLVVSWMNLLHPERRTLRLVAKMIGHIAVVSLFVFLLNAGPLIVPARLGNGEAEDFATIVNTCVRVSLLAAVIANVVDIVRAAIKLVRRSAAYSSF